jgi:hypothetical protein
MVKNLSRLCSVIPALADDGARFVNETRLLKKSSEDFTDHPGMDRILAGKKDSTSKGFCC